MIIKKNKIFKLCRPIFVTCVSIYSAIIVENKVLKIFLILSAIATFFDIIKTRRDIEYLKNSQYTISYDEEKECLDFNNNNHKTN